GLYRYRPRDGWLDRVTDATPGAAGVVHAVEVHRRGRVWLATSQRRGLYEPASQRSGRFRHALHHPRSLAGDLGRALHDAADGTLWTGTHPGLALAHEAHEGTIAFSQPLAKTLGDHAVSTVFSIVESPAGMLWLGTDNGILRFEPGTSGTLRHFTQPDGLQDVEFNGGAATVLADGRVAMGGVSGLNLFDPSRIQPTAYDAPLRLIGAGIGADAPDDGTVL